MWPGKRERIYRDGLDVLNEGIATKWCREVRGDIKNSEEIGEGVS